MLMTLTAPCDNCPFRTDVQPYLQPARAREIAQMLTTLQGTFSCHKTTRVADDDDDDDDGSTHIPTATEQHCAGALIMLEHMQQPNQLMRIYERIGGYDRTKLKMTAPVYRSTAAFVTAHRQRQPQRATRKRTQ